MNRIAIEAPELNEQAWSAFVQKGKLADRARARRWRIFAGMLIALVGITCALYATLVRD